jgi:hypothetical protein
MSWIEAATERWGRALPDDYLEFVNLGLASSDPSTGICLSRLTWWSPEQIAQCRWPAWKIRDLLPFAKTPGGDHYAWRFHRGGTFWIAECPRDSDYGKGVAPTFRDFVYRSVLEELAGSWLQSVFGLSTTEVENTLRSYVDRLRVYLPPPHVDTLRSCLASGVRDIGDETCAAIADDRFEEIVKRDLWFPHFGEKFKQHGD